jgi:hypothetical protein
LWHCASLSWIFLEFMGKRPDGAAVAPPFDEARAAPALDSAAA